MIISRTPFRISFFGGGTDYPAWFRENGGGVLSTSIDKYCYISCRYLPPFFQHKYRIVYSLIENVREVAEIKHPSVRETLRFRNVSQGIEVHHDGDLPARAGLGSSSSFTVGMLHSIYALQGIMPSKMQLAREAVHIEQDLIGECVGCQDQVSAAFGGFNHTLFKPDGSFEVKPVIVDRERLQRFKSHLMFYFTGFSRIASEVAEKQVATTPSIRKELSEMQGMVEESIAILTDGKEEIARFGSLLHESWKLKRSLTDLISTPLIDEIYEKAIAAGALGGKLLGAGGGGFMLIFAPPDLQGAVAEKLDGLLRVPFDFESAGSQIVVYQPEEAYERQ